MAFLYKDISTSRRNLNWKVLITEGGQFIQSVSHGACKRSTFSKGGESFDF